MLAPNIHLVKPFNFVNDDGWRAVAVADFAFGTFPESSVGIFAMIN